MLRESDLGRHNKFAYGPLPNGNIRWPARSSSLCESMVAPVRRLWIWMGRGYTLLEDETAPEQFAAAAS
jgi:hypothetical protein